MPDNSFAHQGPHQAMTQYVELDPPVSWVTGTSCSGLCAITQYVLLEPPVSYVIGTLVVVSEVDVGREMVENESMTEWLSLDKTI